MFKKLDQRIMDGLQDLSDWIYEKTEMDSVYQARLIAIVALLFFALTEVSPVLMGIGVLLAIAQWGKERELQKNPRNPFRDGRPVDGLIKVVVLLVIIAAGYETFVNKPQMAAVILKDLGTLVLMSLWTNMNRLDLQVTKTDDESEDGPRNSGDPLNQGAGA